MGDESKADAEKWFICQRTSKRGQVAGVHRRAVRRTFGVGANLGYRGFHPVARAAVAGAAWGGGWGGWGWQRPWRPGLYAYAGTAPGWGGGWGWGAPGWGGGWAGWGWHRW